MSALLISGTGVETADAVRTVDSTPGRLLLWKRCGGPKGTIYRLDKDLPSFSTTVHKSGVTRKETASLAIREEGGRK